MTARLWTHASFAMLATLAVAASLVAPAGDSRQAARLSDANLARIVGLSDMSQSVNNDQACAAAYSKNVTTDCSPLNIPNGTACLDCPGPYTSTYWIKSGTKGGPGSFAVTGSVFACSSIPSKQGGCLNGVCGNLGPNRPGCGTAEFQQYSGQGGGF